MAFTNTHLSFSRLQRFEQCPLSFKLHYIDQRKAEHTDKASQASFYISSGGFAVSILSLILSAFGTFAGRRRT